jgi:hypothetical protein
LPDADREGVGVVDVRKDGKDTRVAEAERREKGIDSTAYIR